VRAHGACARRTRIGAIGDHAAAGSQILSLYTYTYTYLSKYCTGTWGSFYTTAGRWWTNTPSCARFVSCVRVGDLKAATPTGSIQRTEMHLHEESGRISQRVRNDWRLACDPIPAPCASPDFPPSAPEVAPPSFDACCRSRHGVVLSPLIPCVRGSLAMLNMTASASSSVESKPGCNTCQCASVGCGQHRAGLRSAGELGKTRALSKPSHPSLPASLAAASPPQDPAVRYERSWWAMRSRMALPQQWIEWPCTQEIGKSLQDRFPGNGSSKCSTRRA
jgi:hypothetical protein